MTNFHREKASPDCSTCEGRGMLRADAPRECVQKASGLDEIVGRYVLRACECTGFRREWVCTSTSLVDRNEISPPLPTEGQPA